MKEWVQEAIVKHLEKQGSSLIGEIIHYQGNVWRALVAVTPSGPLVRMEFGMTTDPTKAEESIKWPSS
jgi:hypothetical protein